VSVAVKPKATTVIVMEENLALVRKAAGKK
jgi:hypothetical protein